LVIAILSVTLGEADAHRSGCHRWHSCPSDWGTYVCGDLGHCSGCPNNAYCEVGKPRAKDRQPAEKQPDQQRPPSKSRPLEEVPTTTTR
jgi:hypothetical protein